MLVIKRWKTVSKSAKCKCRSIKSFILRVKSELVISGHLHENARKENEIGKIKIVICWAFW
jgi:Icc-related predicted phosphoesterase